MGSMSRAQATHLWIPGFLEAFEQEVDGWTLSMERAIGDLRPPPTQPGEPADLCAASHLGYVVRGRFGIRAADGSEEVWSAGDAFVVPPGHTPLQFAGSRWVLFTPTREARAQAAVVLPHMVEYVRRHGPEALDDLPGR